MSETESRVESTQNNESSWSFLKEIQVPGEMLMEDLEMIGKGVEELRIIIGKRWRLAIERVAQIRRK